MSVSAVCSRCLHITISVQGALQHEKNKVSLRNLSMALRQVTATSSEEKISNVEQGLVKGKEAVSMDTTDGQSWSLLGNAYLSHFFQVIVRVYLSMGTLC